MGIRVRSCVWVIASALVVTGCGGTDEAKRGVAEFRSLAAQRAYADIYRTAGAELRGPVLLGYHVNSPLLVMQ